MSKRAKLEVFYGVIAILNSAVSGLAVAISSGAIPNVPVSWSWALALIVVPMLTALTRRLDRVASLEGDPR